MNIFIIPSWYPGINTPLDGIFIKEQAEALSENYPGHNFVISHCGNFYLSFSSIGKTFLTFSEFNKSDSAVFNHRPNLTEIYKPVLTWTDKLGGEVKNILKAHSENYLLAEKQFGKIDIIHAHVSYPAGYSALHLKQKFNTPYILTEHMGPFPFEKYIVNGILSHKISEPISFADAVTAPSNFLANKINSFGFIKPDVIPNLVNEKLFIPEKRKVSNGKLQFLTVCSLIESKGIYELLESILSVSKLNLKCEFLIAGKGELENYIREFISKNSLYEFVKLKINPDRSEIVNMFKECDAFILPSRMESFGIVYIEAFACGKPVIATDCGGPSDFVNKDNGLITEVGNFEKITEAIIYMTENIGRFDEKKIRRFFEENYSAKAVCSEIIKLYEDTIYKFK